MHPNQLASQPSALPAMTAPENRLRKPLNFVAFQVGWFACVLGGAHGMVWASALAVGLLLALHFVWVSHNRREDLLLALAAAGIGGAADSVLGAAGLIRFASPWPLAWVEPLWMLLLWVNFATTLDASLSWMRGRFALGAVLGAIGGPLAYWGGVRLGALELGAAGWQVYGAVALAWAAVMPVLLLVARSLYRDTR
ncbi:MAG: DUF2878 domain-containing protein [Candidatus Sumerlaeia bacterium]|nr:DUF2878 domain-containing protein [Candidatus Sumerlaeia bacterium]